MFLLAFTQPVVIQPNDARLAYVGRFDWRDKEGPKCAWSACQIRFRVESSTITVKMKEVGRDVWQAIVDEVPGKVWTPVTEPEAKIELTPGEHDIRLVKRTEPFVGVTQFGGIEFGNGRLLKPLRSKRRIEFVGDSITCGFGNEGKTANDPFKVETENADQTYATIAARALHAEPTVIAWSGRKMAPDNTMPSIYDLDLPNDPNSIHAFEGPAPDAVVINLATNDFGKENPERAMWTTAYSEFIKRVWSHYPKAEVFVALGSMMSDSYPAGNNALSTARGYLTSMIADMNDKRLHFVEFDVQKQEDGIGSAWHPSVKTHEKMAAQLVPAIRDALHWK